MGSKEVILPISFRLDWRKAINSKAKQIVFDNTIQIGNPTVEIEKDIELVANTPSVVIQDIIIKEHAVVSSITPRKSIFLLIPNDLEVQWNRDFTAVTFSGSASGKLKKTTKYISKKE